MFTKTLRQYETDIREEFFTDKENSKGITRIQYIKDYPPGCWGEEWLNAIREAARNGETIRPLVLDDLFKRQERCFWSLRHDYPRCVPDGYLNPKARHAPRL